MRIGIHSELNLTRFIGVLTVSVLVRVAWFEYEIYYDVYSNTFSMKYERNIIVHNYIRECESCFVAKESTTTNEPSVWTKCNKRSQRQNRRNYAVTRSIFVS